jgi:uncharacterized protein YndB with AHSA1/START domain
VQQDHEAKTLTITAEFDAPIERAWKLWEDPRLLEQWWGPPTYPATFVDHDITVGGRIAYFMTGPEGDHQHGWWRVRAVDAPRSLEFDNGFADEAGNPDPTMPAMVMRVALERVASGGTRMVVETTFPSAEAMAQLIEMGMEEGMSAAMSQIDGLL